MKNKKIKCLILIIALFITRSQLYVFSETQNSRSNNNQNIEGEPPREGNITLDGQIGEWDPTDSEAPNFNDQNLEIEGNKPTQEQYFTISVTVPISMEFFVLHNTQKPFGSFYSPEYSISNNGSKTLEVKINSFDRQNNTRVASDETPLYVGNIVPGDGHTQMELRLSAIDTYDKANNKDIDLTEVSSLTGDDNKLYDLEKNQTKKVKFSADKWELPQYESKKAKAMSNFTAGFEFSIKSN